MMSKYNSEEQLRKKTDMGSRYSPEEYNRRRKTSVRSRYSSEEADSRPESPISHGVRLVLISHNEKQDATSVKSLSALICEHHNYS